MSEDRRLRVRALFDQALDLPPEERDTLLDAACRDDPDLRAQVEALLEADDGASRILAGVDTLLVGAPPASSLGVFVPGRVIAGRYTLLEVLGEGGMGTVYRAEQVQPVKRQVALKLMKTGMDTRAVLARFDAERQALALMDHPNIARVYDGGATEANEPFFVMEFVDGVAITEYCDRRRLAVPTRLELFVSVCEAVQHAHQKRIIHRDLKPGNILVTEVDGRPTAKVIDFGVAKATDFDLAGQSSADADAVVGTPAYMSPEQADPSTMDIDTRTDIYALGAVLYELLAGSPPFDAEQFKSGAILDILHLVREIDPPRPSSKARKADALPGIAARRGVAPERLRRALKGDLNWIVMKALEKERTRRYQTASGFAADIRRHLAHEPVVAAPPSRVYRVGKFVRKYRGGVIAAGLVLLALLAGIAGTTAGLVQARRLEKIAREETRMKEMALLAEAERADGERRATRSALAAAAAEKKAKERAETAEETSRKLLYTTDMQLIPLLWKDPHTTAVQLRTRLNAHIPAQNGSLESQDDPRGFEWYYYQHLLGQSAAVFSGPAASVVAARFTANGQLVTLDQQGQLRRWKLGPQVEDEASRRDLAGGPSKEVPILSPDGRLAALARGNKVHVFDTSLGSERFQIDSPGDRPRHLIFSRDSDKLVIVDDNIRWLSTASGEVIASSDQRTQRYSIWAGLALSADGLTLAVTGLDGPVGTRSGNYFSIFRLDATNRTVTPGATDVKHGTLSGSALSPDGRRIAVGVRLLGELAIFDTTTGRLIARNGSAHASAVAAIAFSGDGARLATADSRGTIKIWEDPEKLTSKSVALLTLKGHQGEIESVCFSIDGKQLLSTSADRTVRVWDLENSEAAIRRLERSGAAPMACFSPDGHLIAAAGGSVVRLWDAATGRLVRALSAGDEGTVHSVAFSPEDNRLLAVGYGEQADSSHVALWNIDSGAELARLPGAIGLPGFSRDENSHTVGAMAFSPDGKYLVAGFGTKRFTTEVSSPSPLKVWEVATRRLLHRLSGHTGYCVSLNFSRDAALLASGSRDGTAILWSTSTWDKTRMLQNPDRGTEVFDNQAGRRFVDDVAFSPDGKTLAMASRAGNVHLWEVATGKLLETLTGHSGAVQAVVFAPDGHTLASGSSDQTVRLWNVQTRRELMPMDAATIELGSVFTVAFSPDGKQLLAGGLRGVAFWAAAPIVWNDPDRAAEKLRLLLESNADFQSRIRMLSENLRMHEALERLDAGDVRVQAALAATQANWHASRQAWPATARAVDRLIAADPVHPAGWLRTPGLLRLATALLQEDRPSVAAMLLQGGAERRTQDGLPPISRVVGFGLRHSALGGALTLTGVEADSPGARSNLRTGDVVLKVNGVEMTSETFPRFDKMLESGTVGTIVRLTVRHPGSTPTDDVALTKASYRVDNTTGELFFPLWAAIQERLAKAPRDAGLLELRAALAGQEADFAEQATDSTAAIETLAEPDVVELLRSSRQRAPGMRVWRVSAQ
jgi:WD40 repeat protein/tRNA A-37 threonylcarbamoyl transferase component Bud32